MKQAFKFSRALYTPQLRMVTGEITGPWFSPGMSTPFKSPQVAESIADLFATWWLGAAESRAKVVHLNADAWSDKEEESRDPCAMES